MSHSSKTANVPIRTPSVEILEMDDRVLKFALNGTDPSVANAMRRVMMAEVPTMCIDTVFIDENSSVLHDEFLSHRLGLIPIRWVGGERELGARQYPVYWECPCEVDVEGFCKKCSIKIILDVSNDIDEPEGDALAVTSYDLQIVWPYETPCPFEIAHFVDQEDAAASSGDNGILITKLGPNQRIYATCVARMGIGKVHAKWNPTATVSMKYDPEIVLNNELMQKIERSDRRAFVNSCTKGVFEYLKKSRQVIVKDAKAANNIDEINRIGAIIARKYGFSENIVSATFAPERYIFTVEASGALYPEVILDTALSVLIDKMKTVKTECVNLMASSATSLSHA